MTEREEPEQDRRPENRPRPPATVDPTSRSAPRRRGNTEQALGLEVARLFGLSPRLLVAPAPPPEAVSTGDEEATEDGAEDPESRRGGT